MCYFFCVIFIVIFFFSRQVTSDAGRTGDVEARRRASREYDGVQRDPAGHRRQRAEGQVRPLENFLLFSFFFFFLEFVCAFRFFLFVGWAVNHRGEECRVYSLFSLSLSLFMCVCS